MGRLKTRHIISSDIQVLGGRQLEEEGILAQNAISSSGNWNIPVLVFSQLGDKTANRVNGHQAKSYQGGQHGSRYSTGHVVRAAEVGQSFSKSAWSYRHAAQTCATR